MIKFGNAFIKPYIKEHHYHELEEIYGIYKEILILSDNPKFPDVTDQLFRISVMRNPHQRPLRLFLMIFYPTLKEEEMKEISFKGFNAMQLNFGQSVEIFIAKEKLVYALYPGQVTWAKRGKDRVFFPLQSTSLWEQFINSFSP